MKAHLIVSCPSFELSHPSNQLQLQLVYLLKGFVATLISPFIPYTILLPLNNSCSCRSTPYFLTVIVFLFERRLYTREIFLALFQLTLQLIINCFTHTHSTNITNAIFSLLNPCYYSSVI